MTTASAASAASSSSASTTSSTASSKTSTTRTTKCRVQVGDNAAQTDPVNLQQTLNGVGNGGDAGILCPELHCQRRFKHESALRNHRFRAHKAPTDSIATSSAFATSSAATLAAVSSSSARSIVDDCVGSALTTTAAAQSKGPSLLLHAKQRCFDGDEDVSSGGGIKKTQDDARLCIAEEKDRDDGVEAEEEEEDCSSSTLIRSASSGMMENNKLDCFVLSSSRCLQSTPPIICSGSVQMSSCGAKLASSAAAAAEMENGTGDAAALDSSDCAVSDGAVPTRDGGECITVVCADRQKMRNGAKKHCKGRLDRGGVQKNSESSVVSSQMLLGQSSTTVVGEEASAAGASVAGASVAGASVAGASVAGALLSLHSSEDKHCAKKLKTNGGMPFSMLSVSLNRIPMENNDSSLTRKTTVPAAETRSDDRLQDAERSGSSSCSAAVDSVRGLGLDVAKLCIVSGFGSGPAAREPSAGKTPSQSLFAMRGEVMGRYPPEKIQVDNCHLVKSGSMHTEEIAKPQLESSCMALLPGKGQNGSDSQTSIDRALTPSKLVFQSSKTCHDKLFAPGIVHDGNQKQAGLHSGSSFMFATDSSKSLLNHVGKESTPVSHLSYVDKTKPELSTSFAKGIPTSAFSLRNSTGESIGSQAVKQKCPSFSNLDQAIIPDRGCTAISSSAVPSGGSGPTVYAKDMMMMCDLNSFTSNVQKDFSDLKGALPPRSAIPFAVPLGSRSIPNGNLTWTTSPFVSSMSSLQHTTTRSKASSDPPPLTSRGSTYVTALASSSMSSSALTADCSFVPFCRAIQGAPATTTSLPKQMNKFCAPPPPSPPLASCPLEANTASEVFVRRDDGSWTSASGGGKSAQQQQQQQHAMISNASCPDRNLLVCGDISLPLPLQSPLSSSSGLSSSSATDLYHGGGGGGVIPYQQKKEKMLSALHSSAMKPPQSSSTNSSSSSSSSRSLLTGHSVQAACPK